MSTTIATILVIVICLVLALAGAGLTARERQRCLHDEGAEETAARRRPSSL